MQIRKSFILSISIFVAVHLHAQIAWDGGGFDNQWNTAANWVGDIVPGPADNVVLDNIHGVAGNFVVNLPAGNTSITVNSLTITPSAGNTITLILPFSNTSSTAFRATGPGDAVILNNGAVFKNSSGAASGTPVSVISTNFFRINNGGRYIHNTPRSHTDFLVSRLSTAPGTEKGVFEFNVPQASSTISVSGRTYGTLELSSAAMASGVSYLGSGSNMLRINGDLVIDSNVRFSTDISNNIIIQNDLLTKATSGFNISTGNTNTIVNIKGSIDCAGNITESGTGLPSIYLNGTLLQNIRVSGSISNTIDFNLNNTAGAILLADLILPYQFSLTAGNLTTGNYDISTPMINQAGPMPGSHIITNGNGVVMLTGIGISPVTFPVGIDATSVNPLVIANGNGTAFGVRVQAGIFPASIALGNYAINRTWTIESAYSGPPVNVDFFYNAGEGNSAFSYSANIEVGQYIGSVWNTVQSGIIPSGSYQASTHVITSFNTQFVLANQNAILAIPAVVTLKAKSERNTIDINWELENVSSIDHIEIEKSVNDQLFSCIGRENGNVRLFRDISPVEGDNYYRIKIVYSNGIFRYSKTVAVKFHLLNTFITAISNNTAILYCNRNMRLQFVLYDVNGRVIRRWYDNIYAGVNKVFLSAFLKPAVYFLAIYLNGERIQVVDFSAMN